jgi:hypothetical protein
MTLPLGETANEKTFSVGKCIVGDRGAKAKKRFNYSSGQIASKTTDPFVRNLKFHQDEEKKTSCCTNSEIRSRTVWLCDTSLRFGQFRNIP